MRLFAIAMTVIAAQGAVQTGLERAKAEPNLERRSQMALDHATDVLRAARDAYGKGDIAAVKPLLLELGESVQFAADSLRETGKNPRKSPKWFKKAEIETRELVRRLSSFEQEMSVADRPAVESVKSKVQQVHDDLLQGLMEGKKK